MGKIKHGHTTDEISPEYTAWQSMKSRCSPESAVAERYFHRGITVCSRWTVGEQGMSGFECFLADLGERPTTKHSLDRKENSDGYSPDNCRWATDTEQNRNRRFNRMVTINGETMPFVEAVERHGKVSWTTARMRVHTGWDDVAAITLPLQSRRPRRAA